MWTFVLSALAVLLAAFAVHVAFTARMRAECAEQHARDAADIAEAAIKTHNIPREARQLRRIATGTDTASPWTPPNG